MFAAIGKMRQAKEDRNQLERLRVRLHAFNELLRTEDPTFMVRTASRIRRCLEHRFGPEGVTEVNNDDELMREDKLFDCFSPTKLFEISTKLSDEEENIAIADDDYAPSVSLMLMSGWLKAKAIQHRSSGAHVVSEAKEHAELFLFHIQSLLRILRGEPASNS
jgi:hypothetical protein